MVNELSNNFPSAKDMTKIEITHYHKFLSPEDMIEIEITHCHDLVYDGDDVWGK